MKLRSFLFFTYFPSSIHRPIHTLHLQHVYKRSLRLSINQSGASSRRASAVNIVSPVHPISFSFPAPPTFSLFPFHPHPHPVPTHMVDRHFCKHDIPFTPPQSPLNKAGTYSAFTSPPVAHALAILIQPPLIYHINCPTFSPHTSVSVYHRIIHRLLATIHKSGLSRSPTTVLFLLKTAQNRVLHSC